MKQIFILLILCTSGVMSVLAQDKNPKLDLDYRNPKEYIIGGVTVSGNEVSETNIITYTSGLLIYQTITIPGDKLSMAVTNLWKQEIFDDVSIAVTELRGDTIYLHIHVVERPKLSKFSIRGLRKQATKNIRDEISLKKGQVLTENIIRKTDREIKAYYHEKGFWNVDIKYSRTPDTSIVNSEILRIQIKKGKKVKVEDIIIRGNKEFTDKMIRKQIKPKAKKHKLIPFISSKLIEDEYDEEKQKIVAMYNSKGFRDASLVSDSIVLIKPNRVNIILNIEEGTKYYFRNIKWVGNTKYRSTFLDTVLNIREGDVYNQGKLDTRLFMNPSGFDISSLYMDDGYLFFSLNPVEVNVSNDSIDLEIRIYEGKQAIINKIIITGNDKTSDHVILRAIRTVPGQKFSRTDIQRSLRELASLTYFDPEKLDVNPIPNPANGTVDIEYKVSEKPSDQIEASGGFGGGFGFVGSVGLTLNNFSTKRMTERGGWNPIPAGDGQRLTLRAQSNGLGYQAYNFSFTEPWLGGKKPNSLTLSVFHSLQTNFLPKSNPDRATFGTTGATIALGKLLDKPDDYFILSNSLSYQRYSLDKWTGFGASDIGFTEGVSNSISFNHVLTRNSTSSPIYPKSGSEFSASVQWTPPFSLLSNKDYTELVPQERFKWIEYHKWKFNAKWYLEPIKNKKFVISPQFYFGGIGIYNKDVGYSPFEQFRVGGSGFGSWAFYGTEIIPQKGYDESSISDPSGRKEDVDPIFTKFSLELRYPLSLNPSATVYGYTYFEAGNAWDKVSDYNPFNLRRAVGAGARLFLPMFGLLSFDYGFGLDHPNGELQGQFLFSIGQSF
jgi:outer membrane protein insertion porin family